VLYDPGCRVCAVAARWLARQPRLLRLDLVPVGSAEARRRFPALDHAATGREVTVVGDGGQVYRGDSAWIVCLWALSGHREFSHTLTGPAGRRLARAAVLTAARYRGSQQHGSRAVAPGARSYAVAPGWTYDPVAGWSRAAGGKAGPQCADGCGTEPPAPLPPAAPAGTGDPRGPG